MPAPENGSQLPPENVTDQAKRLGVGGASERAEEPTQDHKKASAELTPLDSPLADLDYRVTTAESVPSEEVPDGAATVLANAPSRRDERQFKTGTAGDQLQFKRIRDTE